MKMRLLGLLLLVGFFFMTLAGCACNQNKMQEEAMAQQAPPMVQAPPPAPAPAPYHPPKPDRG